MTEPNKVKPKYKHMLRLARGFCHTHTRLWCAHLTNAVYVCMRRLTVRPNCDWFTLRSNKNVVLALEHNKCVCLKIIPISGC